MDKAHKIVVTTIVVRRGQERKAVSMAFTLYSLIQTAILCINAVAVLHEERFLSKSKWFFVRTLHIPSITLVWACDNVKQTGLDTVGINQPETLRPHPRSTSECDADDSS